MYVSLLFSSSSLTCFFFFFNDTATTEIYTLSLHDALPIYENVLAPQSLESLPPDILQRLLHQSGIAHPDPHRFRRSEEHTSELQSQSNLVCRLLLEKKKKKTYNTHHYLEHY